MLFDHPLPSGALALLVLTAIAAPARGEGLVYDFAAPGDIPYSGILPDRAGTAPQHFAADALDLGQGLSLTPSPSRAAVTLRVGDLALRVGVLGAGPALPEGPPEATGGLLEVSRSFGKAAVSVSMSQITEPLAYLGSRPAHSSGLRVSTSTLQLAGAVMIAPNLAIAGQAAYGMLPDSRSGDRLANGISRAGTGTFSFALVAADRVRRGDRLSVSLSQPMRSNSGRFMMEAGSAARERLVFSMVPFGSGMRAQLNYQMPAGYGAAFGLSLVVRRNPNDLADSSVETLVVARYVKSF